MSGIEIIIVWFLKGSSSSQQESEIMGISRDVIVISDDEIEPKIGSNSNLKRPSICLEDEGIDLSNIITNGCKRPRRQTKRYDDVVFSSKKYRDMMLCDVPNDELKAALIDDVDDHQKPKDRNNGYRIKVTCENGHLLTRKQKRRAKRWLKNDICDFGRFLKSQEIEPKPSSIALAGIYHYFKEVPPSYGQCRQCKGPFIGTVR